MGNFGVNGGVPWLTDTDGALSFICKTGVEDLNYFVTNGLFSHCCMKLRLGPHVII